MYGGARETRYVNSRSSGLHSLLCPITRDTLVTHRARNAVRQWHAHHTPQSEPIVKTRHIKRHLFGLIGCTNAVRNPRYAPYGWARRQ